MDIPRVANPAVAQAPARNTIDEDVNRVEAREQAAAAQHGRPDTDSALITEAAVRQLDASEPDNNDQDKADQRRAELRSGDQLAERARLAGAQGSPIVNQFA